VLGELRLEPLAFGATLFLEPAAFGVAFFLDPATFLIAFFFEPGHRGNGQEPDGRRRGRGGQDLDLGAPDRASHRRQGVDRRGRTIAVVASGLDIIYPPPNRALAHRIVESGRGVILSEYPLGVKPEGGNFPARNRIISGLSLGVLVIEAPPKSGALITVEHALKQGREVFAVPGSILSSRSAGTNKLIQDGARPVMEVKDIIESLNLFMIPQQIEMQTVLPDNDEERALLALLSHEPRHIDDLIRETDLAAMIVSSTLTMMELKGIIRQVGGMQYVLAR